MDFFLGVASSLVATIIFVVTSRMSLRWPYPRGVRFIPPDRDKYLKHIAELIRNNRRRFPFKGFTGFDLFSSDMIKRAFEETRIDAWQELVFVLTDPKSRAFSSELNKSYTPDKLTRLQETVTEFLSNGLFAGLASDGNRNRGIFYLGEDKNFFNLLVLDELAFFFFRGFTEQKGPAGQVIIQVNLSKCPKLVKELVNYVAAYYIQRCTSQSTKSKVGT